jgi:transposase
MNTDRRDAIQLARLLCAGTLTPVSVPTVAEEALRDLRRAREETLRALNAATPRRHAVLLRHDSRSTGHATGGPAPLRGLSAGGCPPPAPQSVFQAYVRAGTDHQERLQRRAHERHDQVQAGRRQAVGDALHALRGVQGPGAVTTGAELGDLTRVETPRQLLSDLGLTPAAYSPGARRRQGSMTKAGTAHARRALIEGAWACRSPAQRRRPLHVRLDTLPTPLQASRWTAQGRLWQRDRQLSARGTHAHQVVGAIARQLRAWMGPIAREVPLPGHPSALFCRAHEGDVSGHRPRRRPGVAEPSTA